MNRTAAVLYGMAAIILLAFGVSVGRQCAPGLTKAERKADSVLADTTRFLGERERRDSVITAGQAETRKLKAENQRLKQSVRILIDSVDHERTEAATLTPLPSGITSHDSIVRLDSALQAQIRVAARLRDEVVPRLQQVIRNDSTTIWRMDAVIEEQRVALTVEYRKNDELTKALAGLREDSKPKNLTVLGVTVPGWVDDVALAGASAYLGYKVGQAAGRSEKS